jgi:hypothetical protein
LRLPPRFRFRLARLAALLVLVAACESSGDGGAASSGGDRPGDSGLVAHVASYDLVVGQSGRFMVGLVASDNTRLVSFGTVELDFSYLGMKDAALERPEPGATTSASFLPLPGQRIHAGASGPRFVDGTEADGATGVYAARGVRFDRPGLWQVRASAWVGDRRRTAVAAFEVLADSPVPNVGDAAPRTRNPLPGAPGVDASSIDSRAGPGEPVPDPELHSTTVEEAMAAHKPVMVVVSTPTYCESRFCGPVTEAVSALAKRHGAEMAFVHLEVWRNFQQRQQNDAAREWISPPGTQDPREPWVFVVDRAGTITHRFDNVASDAELEQAAMEVIRGPR